MMQTIEDSCVERSDHVHRSARLASPSATTWASAASSRVVAAELAAEHRERDPVAVVLGDEATQLAVVATDRAWRHGLMVARRVRLPSVGSALPILTPM